LIQYDLDKVETNIQKIRDALCKYQKDVGSDRMPLNRYHTGRSTGLVDNPTMHAAEIDRHRFDNIFTDHLDRLAKFRGLFCKTKDEMENHALAHLTSPGISTLVGKDQLVYHQGLNGSYSTTTTTTPATWDGNDNPALDPIELYHRKQGKHNAFSGIMMIRKKRSKIPSFNDIFNTNYRLYLTIEDYKRAPPPTTPWTELILEGLNLNPRKTRSIVLTITAIAALVAVSAATIGGVYLAKDLERQKRRKELYAGISALTLDGVAQLSSTQEELNRITQEVIKLLEVTSEHGTPVNISTSSSPPSNVAWRSSRQPSSAPWTRRSPSSASWSSTLRALP
jgi:hypothetical protein